jgi:serine/threonine protein kinase/tetratricopeptide (TPR) repeat protein
MPEQAGNDPNERLPTGTVHLVRDSSGSVAPAGPTAAETGAGVDSPDNQATLPVDNASLAQAVANTASGAAASSESKSPSQRAPTAIRFRHLQSWREGGLGRVYIALDEELHREVALKEIKPQYAGNRNSQERFLLEGEITGSLEHPGIVPIYGMGRYNDGRPYYAMRFVHGESLEEAIRRYHDHLPLSPTTGEMATDPRGPAADKVAPGGLEATISLEDARKAKTIAATTQADVAATQAKEQPANRAVKATKDELGERIIAFRELLSRFIAVCNAIAYAHSRGVIHRDLKPANILLAKYGETLVVDWGLAKAAGRADQAVSDSGEAPLEVQSGSGSTPTRFGTVVGTPAFMSPEQADGRSDLMGPASDIYSLGATLYYLLTGQCPFTSPRLDTVLTNVRKGEFPRPREVKPEVPRALEAICVKAMALKREDRYSTASALADDLEHWLADEPVSAHPERGLELAARWVRRHKSAALTSAIGLLLVAVVAIGAAVLVNRQRIIADEARKNADLAFREARNAVDDLFTKVSEDSLLNQPGLQGIRKDLLQKTLDYYEKFLQQRADDPTVQEEYAATLFRAGRIIDELQSPEQSLPYLQQARDIQAQLMAEAPQNADRLKALGDTENAMGRSLHRSQQFQRALVEYTKGRDLRKKLVELVPDDAELKRASANSVMNIGLVEKDLGHLDVAAEQLQTSQKLRESQLPAEDSFRLDRDLAMGSYNQGILELKRNKPGDAATYFSQAIERFAALAQKEPRDLTIQYYLATCYRKAADAQSENQAPEEAAKLYEQARDAFARLADRNPDVDEYQSALAQTYLNIGGHQAGAAAIASFEKSQAILQELVAKYPKNPQFRRDLAIVLRELGLVQVKSGDREKGLANMQHSVKRLEKLVEEFPDRPDLKSELETSRRMLDEAVSPPSQVESA